MTCSRNTGVDCEPQKKPLAVATCYVQDCPQVVDNFGIDWSGSGWSSKEVLNEINSIVVGAPKFSTTRAQPRNHNDLNNIVEGDFDYHNNIENIDRSSENNVQVDDFYYDYNFINFHEDLSDDFESDEKESGESHSFDNQQEAEPTHSVTGNMETTKAPSATSVISKATADEPVSQNLDNMEDSGDDFLSEDYLLPVSTTRSPSLHTTQHPPPLKERHDISTMPSLVVTTQEPAQDVKLGQNVEEDENNYDSFSEEEDLTEDVTVTPQQAAPTPGNQTTIHVVVATTSAQETEGHDDYEHSYIDRSTTGTDISSEQEGAEKPELTSVDESESEIPHTTSQATIFAFTLEDVEKNPTDFNTVYNNIQKSWDTDLDLSATSLPAPQKSTPLPVPFPLTSGNPQPSDDSLTGTEIIPPMNLEVATQPPPAGVLQTDPVFTDRTGTDPTSRAPSFDSADFDYNEIVVHTMLRSSSDSDPATGHHSTIAAPHLDSQAPAVPTLPTHPPALWPIPVPTSVQTSASTQVTTAAYWVASNWSAVSLH